MKVAGALSYFGFLHSLIPQRLRYFYFFLKKYTKCSLILKLLVVFFFTIDYLLIIKSYNFQALVEFREGASRNKPSGVSTGICRFCGATGSTGLLAIGNVCADHECQEHARFVFLHYQLVAFNNIIVRKCVAHQLILKLNYTL